MRQQIATALAQAYKEVYGRGPDKVAAHLAQGHVLFIVEGVGSPVLDTLARTGAREALAMTQERLQAALAAAVVPAVEPLLGRSVRTVVSGYDAQTGAATHTLLLEAAEHAGTPDWATVRRPDEPPHLTLIA